MKGETVVTEHKGSPSFEQLFGMLEPVDLRELERGNLLEILRVRKNLDALMNYLIGLVPIADGDEEETREVIEDARVIVSRTQAVIGELQFFGKISAVVANGAALRSLYAEAVGSMTHLARCWDTALVLPMEDALIKA